MINLIGITGKKGCGKTAASEALIDYQEFTKISFANPLKFMLFSLGLSKAELWGDEKEVPSDLLCGQTPRHAMQMLGTEWGHDLIHKDIWVSAWKDLVKKCKAPVVVDDLRFLNEANMVKKLGGKIILIDRPSLVSEDLHISETEIEKLPYDEKIINDGSLFRLKQKVVGYVVS